MFKNIVLKYLKSSIEDGEIYLNQQQCINNNYMDNSCSKCKEVCRIGAINLQNGINQEKCIHCNLCSIVCPVQAIIPPKRLLYDIEIISTRKDSAFVMLICEKHEYIQADLKVKCIASIAWELYIAISLKKIVLIYISDCKECNERDEAEARLKEVFQFSGDKYFKKRFILKTSNKDLGGMTRKEMAHLTIIKSVDTINKIINPLPKFTMQSLFYRKYLYNVLKNTKVGELSDVSFNWKKPIFNTKCWGCGLCAVQCPNEALILVRNRLCFVPWRCTQCEICKKYCPEQGIDGWDICKFRPLQEKYVEADIEVTYCKVCGKAMRKMEREYLCLYCGESYHVDGDRLF